MKYIKFITICTLIFLAFNIAYADKYHGIVYVGQPTETINNVEIKGIASAIATAQHNFDYSTLSWQGSVGIGIFDSRTAFSFALGKRFNKTLINGSISQEEGKFGGGLGLNFTF